MIKQTRKHPSPQLTLDTASRVLDQDSTYSKAAEPMGIDFSPIRRWVKPLKDERAGHTPSVKAVPAEPQGIQALKAGVAELEMEKTILKRLRRSCCRALGNPVVDPQCVGAHQRGRISISARDF